MNIFHCKSARGYLEDVINTFSSVAEMKVRIGTFVMSNSYTNEVQFGELRKPQPAFFYKNCKYFLNFMCLLLLSH